MFKEEIEAEIADWEQRKFMNQMDDHWGADEYAFDRKCSEMIAQLKKKLEELKG